MRLLKEHERRQCNDFKSVGASDGSSVWFLRSAHTVLDDGYAHLYLHGRQEFSFLILPDFKEYLFLFTLDTLIGVKQHLNVVFIFISQMISDAKFFY